MCIQRAVDPWGSFKIIFSKVDLKGTFTVFNVFNLNILLSPCPHFSSFKCWRKMKWIRQQRKICNSLGKSHLFEGNLSRRDNFPWGSIREAMKIGGPGSKRCHPSKAAAAGTVISGCCALCHCPELRKEDKPFLASQCWPGGRLTQHSVRICWLRSQKWKQPPHRSQSVRH